MEKERLRPFACRLLSVNFVVVLLLAFGVEPSIQFSRFDDHVSLAVWLPAKPARMSFAGAEQ